MEVLKPEPRPDFWKPKLESGDGSGRRRAEVVGIGKGDPHLPLKKGTSDTEIWDRRVVLTTSRKIWWSKRPEGVSDDITRPPSFVRTPTTVGPPPKTPHLWGRVRCPTPTGREEISFADTGSRDPSGKPPVTSETLTL